MANEDTNKFTIITGIVLVVIIGLWFVTYFTLKNQPDASRGTFGDMFGGLNALFSGLAFAGIIFTIFLQREELQLQRRELKETRAELERTAVAQEKSLQISQLQLESFDKTNKAQFLNNLESKIFDTETISLITIIHSNSLKFINNSNFPIFKIEKNNLISIYPKTIINKKGYYTSYEMDWHLLNHLDVIGSHVVNKIIDIYSAKQYFEWYLLVVINNEAIKDYFNWLENYEKSTIVFENISKMRDIFLQYDNDNSILQKK